MQAYSLILATIAISVAIIYIPDKVLTKFADKYL